MPKDHARSNLRAAVGKVTDYLTARGVALPAELKRRDPREPGRKEKEAAQERLTRLVLRHLRRQKERIITHLTTWQPARQVKAEYQIPDEVFDDPEFEAGLITLLTAAAQGGAGLLDVGFDLDYTLTNKEAAAWARDYSYELVKDINDATRAALAEQVQTFVTTPGYNIGNIEAALADVFGPDRAQRIAITEITRAYASGNQLAGEQLAGDFPDIRVVKKFFTNNDERVCFICEPLNGQSVSIDEDFRGGDGGKYANPPLHINCRCWASTTTEIVGLQE